MRFRYRFRGKVNSQFVIRGMLFRVGSKIDFCLTEQEVEFAKKHCTVIEIIDREPPVVVDPTPAPTPKPTPKPKQENIVKEAKANDGARKKTNRQVKV